MILQQVLWQLADHFPGPVRASLRPAVAAARRSRRHATELPDGDLLLLPDDAIELDTLVGTLWFDAGDNKLTPWIRRHAVWEADVVRLLQRTLRAGSTFVDVGANVGFHSVVASRLVGPLGSVVAVEPEPFSLELLRANLWRHRCENARIYAVAASDAAGETRLAPDAAGRSGSALTAGPGLPVETARLDELLGDVTVDVLKVDVEGAEPLVLRGAQELLERSRSVTAVVELRAGHLDGSTASEALALYQEMGFSICSLRPSGQIVPAERNALLRSVAGDATANVVLCRKS
jgi:FkbM family methyltransferase